MLHSDLIAAFKYAIEIGKWPDGQKLSTQQLETCIQAVMLYEHHHLPPEERTGYLPPRSAGCESENLKWKN